MTTLSIGPVRRWRRLAGLFAVLLAIASAVPVYAGPAGIVNGSFGSVGNCNVAFWTGTGSFYATETSFNKGVTKTCAGKVSVLTGLAEASLGDNAAFASSHGSVNAQSTTNTSTIEQRFIVNPADTVLTFYLKPESDQPSSSYLAQNVSLYDSSGQLIYSKSRNSTLTSDGPAFAAYVFTYDLTGYANQYVTLRVSASINSSTSESPTVARLSIDFDHPDPGRANGPGNVPIGVW